MFVASDLRELPPPYAGAAIALRGQGEPLLNKAAGIYNGVPNAEDFLRIQNHIGPIEGVEASTPDDWRVYSANACDNSLDITAEAFTLSVLKQYSDRAIGRPLLINHNNRDVDSTRGFIIESGIMQADKFPEHLREDVMNRAATDFLVELAGGYYWVFLKVAVPANTQGAIALEKGLIDRLSVGFFSADSVNFCPECTYSRKENTGFYDYEEVEVTREGETTIENSLLCPHVAPTFWNRLLAWWDGTEDEINWAIGQLTDCAVLPAEISQVVMGAFGPARIIRR